MFAVAMVTAIADMVIVTDTVIATGSVVITIAGGTAVSTHPMATGIIGARALESISDSNRPQIT